MKADENTVGSEKAPFLINSSYQGFTDRQKNVFDQLCSLEHDTKDILSNNAALIETNEPADSTVNAEDVRLQFSRNEQKMRHLRGRDSIFKRPQARAPRCVSNRKVPDYQVHPHKWTRYSLDVPSEDMSDRANTAAAMSFLKEMQLRKQQSENLEGESPKKILFKKALPNQKTDAGETAPVIFRNSKVIMPEYVVGEKRKKEKKPKKNMESGSAKEVKLDHLFENDED